MSLSRNAFYNLAGQAAPLVASLVTIPIYLHLVGVERYGVIAIAWMLLGYFGVFDLGLTRATAYRIALQRDGPAEARALTFWTATSIAFGLALVGAAILYAGGHWYFAGPFEVSPELRAEALEALPVIALALPCSILTGVFSGALQGREHFFEVNVMVIIAAVLGQTAPVLVAWLAGPRLIYVLSATIAIQFSAVAVMWWRCQVRVVPGHAFRVSRAEGRELLRYGGWITVSATLAPVMVVLDRFVIGSFMNAAKVATYALPAQLAQRVSMIPYSVAGALFPRFSAEADRATAIHLSQTSARTAMAVMTPVVAGGICVMGPFLHLWLNNALGAEAVIVGQVALLGWWVNGIAINPFGLLQATGRPKITAILHIVELPVYGALLWGLTVNYGLVGTAGAFTIRSALDCLALCFLAYRRSSDLVVYAFPAVLLTAAIPMIGILQVDAASFAKTAMLVGACCIWSWLVVPRHFRQSLIASLNRFARTSHDAQPIA